MSNYWGGIFFTSYYKINNLAIKDADFMYNDYSLRWNFFLQAIRFHFGGFNW